MVCWSEHGYEISQKYFENIFKCTGSYDLIQEGIQGVESHEKLVSNVERFLSISLTEPEKATLKRALELPELEGLYHSSRTIADALRLV